MYIETKPRISFGSAALMRDEGTVKKIKSLRLGQHARRCVEKTFLPLGSSVIHSYRTEDIEVIFLIHENFLFFHWGRSKVAAPYVGVGVGACRHHADPAVGRSVAGAPDTRASLSAAPIRLFIFKIPPVRPWLPG